MPALFMTREKPIKINYPKSISPGKLKFFFFDQFKILFILLEPLYLYLISANLSYVGIFNIILTVAAIIYMYLLSTKINIEKYYKYLNIIFVIILILKLNVYNKTLLLIIAFLEGLGIKTNELISTMNLYSPKKLTEGYIIISEKIFCITRSLILSIFYFLPLSLKTYLYILIIGVFGLSFTYKKGP